MVGIQYNSLADLNGQALAWCNKVNIDLYDKYRRKDAGDKENINDDSRISKSSIP